MGAPFFSLESNPVYGLMATDVNTLSANNIFVTFSPFDFICPIVFSVDFHNRKYSFFSY